MSSDAPEPSEPAPPQPEAPKKSGRGGLFVKLAVVAVLFGIGLGIGWFLRPRAETSDDADKAAHGGTPPIVLHEGMRKEHLEVGDQRFREGNYAEAIAQYRETLNEAHGHMSGALKYRIAVCEEALGNADKALALYREVVADESFPQGHVPAQVAQGRLLLHTGRYAEAKHYLYPLLFTIEAHRQHRSYMEDVRYYVALAVAQSLPSAKTGAGSWHVVSPTAIPNDPTLDVPDLALDASDELPPEVDPHAPVPIKQTSFHKDTDAKPETPAPKEADAKHDEPPPREATPSKDADANHGPKLEMPTPPPDEPTFRPLAAPAPKKDTDAKPEAPAHKEPDAKRDESPHKEATPPRDADADHGPKLELPTATAHEPAPKPAAEPAPIPAHEPPHSPAAAHPPAAHPPAAHDPKHDVPAHDHVHEPMAAPKAPPKADLLVVGLPRTGTERIVQRGRLAAQPARVLLDRLVTAAKYRSEWSAGAENLVRDRSLRIDLAQWPFQDVVHLLADSLELVAWIDGDVVHFAAPSDAPKALVEASRWNLAQQTARTALLTAPNHLLAAAVSIHLGRLELNADRPIEAILCYEQAIRRQERGPWTVSAYYNLGIVHSGRGDVASARKAFYSTVDAAPGHPLAPLAYAHVARLDLEDGKPASALLTLRRAHRLYPNDPAQAPIAVLTALACCQADDFEGARRTLTAERKVVATSAYREAGALVEAYVLYRLAKVDSNARPETGRLIEALYLPGETISAALETRLLGQACREVGMRREAVRLYAKTLSWYKGPLRPPLELGQAECLLELDERDEATTLLLGLESGPANRWSAEAALHLAKLELDKGNAQASAERCKKLWEEGQLRDPSRILTVWGNSHELLGEHEKASRCFAGNPPE